MNRTPWAQRISSFLIAGSIAGFFLFCAWPGLTAGFDNDDVMNLHFAWSPPFWRFFLSNLVPFTTFYRPSGSAYYRLCYALFGWRPEAFRVVTFALLLTNLFLVYRLGRRLSGVAEIGVFGALLYTFHGHLRQLYVSNGTVYDILCVTFSLLALLYYVSVRQSGLAFNTRRTLVAVALFVAAINAKEMAAVLPALFLIYDCIYDRPPGLRLSGAPLWLWRNGRVAALTLVLAGLAFWGKRQPGSVIHNQRLYTPSFTISALFHNERQLLTELFYGLSFNTTGVVVFYAALFLVAAIAKKRSLWFCAWFALLTPAPILFIPYRGFFVMYLPMVGITLYAAAVLVHGRDWLWRVAWKRPPLSANPWEPERLFLFLGVAALLPLGRNIDSMTTIAVTDEAVEYVSRMHADLMRLNEPLPRRGSVLLLGCPYPADSWGPLQMMQLLYHDRDLWVSRPSMQTNALDPGSFDRTIDFDGQKLVVVRRRPEPTPRKLEYPR